MPVYERFREAIPVTPIFHFVFCFHIPILFDGHVNSCQLLLI